MLSVTLFMSCLSILFVMRSYPGALLLFNSLIAFLISFGDKCLGVKKLS